MPFDLGDTVPLIFLVTNTAGALANATTVVLTVTLPDGSTVAPAVTNPPAVTGTYTVTYTPTVAGPYLARWVATGVNAQAYTDSFDVRSATPPLMFSLTYAKSVLGKTTDADSEKIRNLIESTTSIVEHIVGPVVPRSVTEKVYASGNRDYFVLTYVPVISIQTIVSIQTGGAVYNVADFDIDTATGIVQSLNGRTVAGSLRVTYKAGLAVMPAAIRDAAAFTLKYLWSFQLGPHSGPRDRTLPVLGLGRELPVQVIELLRPYARTGGFA